MVNFLEGMVDDSGRPLFTQKELNEIALNTAKRNREEATYPKKPNRRQAAKIAENVQQQGQPK